MKQTVIALAVIGLFIWLLPVAGCAFPYIAEQTGIKF